MNVPGRGFGTLTGIAGLPPFPADVPLVTEGLCGLPYCTEFWDAPNSTRVSAGRAVNERPGPSPPSEALRPLERPPSLLLFCEALL
eukprot:scaffold323245_cov48-Prasinocladus_malaysianus.AAC.1